MNFLQAVSTFINESNSTAAILNDPDVLREINGFFDEATLVARGVEEHDSPEGGAVSKGAKHFQQVLDRKLTMIHFPDDMNEKSLNTLKSKIDHWDPRPTEPDKSKVIKDTLKAVLTKKYNEKHYTQAYDELKATIRTMPKDTPSYERRKQRLIDHVTNIEKQQKSDNPPDLSKLTNDLKELNRIGQLESGYNAARKELEGTIRWLKKHNHETKTHSPFLPLAEEIKKLTQLRTSSEFGDQETPGGMALHELTETIRVAHTAIDQCAKQHNVQFLTENALACGNLAARLAPTAGANRKEISQAKKIGGVLLGIAGVLLITAGAAFAVGTLGLGIIPALGFGALGCALISVGAGLMGTVTGLTGFGLFKERKPQEMKIKESLEKIKTAIDKKTPPPTPASGQTSPAKGETPKDENKSNDKDPVYSGL